MPLARSWPPLGTWNRVLRSCWRLLTVADSQPARNAASTATNVSLKNIIPPSILELVPNSNPTAGLGIHGLDERGEIGVSDLDAVPARREIDVAQRGRDAAHLAVYMDLAPRRDGETDRRWCGDL